MDKAWGMRARRAGAESTGCNCEESSGQQFCPNLCHSTYLARCICPPNLQRCPCARHPLCVLPCSCPLILGRSISHCVRPVPHRPRGKCALCATTRRRVNGRRRRMRRPPCSLVRHACLELRRLMPTGWSCQVGAGLLGLITSTLFPPFWILLKTVFEPTTESQYDTLHLLRPVIKMRICTHKKARQNETNNCVLHLLSPVISLCFYHPRKKERNLREILTNKSGNHYQNLYLAPLPYATPSH